MFKNESIRGILIGAIAYYAITIILDLLNVNSETIKLVILVVLFLIYYGVIQLLKKKNKS